MKTVAALLLVLLAGCSSDHEPSSSRVLESSDAPIQTFKGYYIFGFERREFRPEEDLAQRWWLSGSVDGCPFLDFDQERYKPWRQTYLVLQGTLSPIGQHGHLGAYKRELKVVKFISCRPPRDGEGLSPNNSFKPNPLRGSA